MSYIQAELLKKIQHYCAYQERCHSEVVNKLYELGCNSHTVNEVVVRLIETNFLNEERFSKLYCYGKFTHKNWGKIKIQQHLKQKGLTANCIKIGLKEIDENQYIATLQKLIEKQKKAYAKLKLKDWQMNYKITQFLISKGYEIDLILKQINS